MNADKHIIKTRDVIVVGSGILGLTVASLVSKETLRHVTVFGGTRGDPERIPPLDTLRNQKWLQSGLLYMRKGPRNGVEEKNQKLQRALARRIWYSRRRLMEFYGMPLPTKLGLFRMDSSAAELFEQDANDCNIPIRRVDDIDAKKLSGAFYRSSAAHFEVPDAPFDEPTLMKSAFKRAVRNHMVEFIEGDISLEVNGRVSVIHQDSAYHADFIVLCAGCGTPQILHNAGIDDADIGVWRSPLARFYGNADSERLILPSSLLADLSSNLTLVDVPAGHQRCTILGGRGRTKLTRTTALTRRVLREEFERLLVPLPTDLAKAALTKGKTTAGHKTERVGVDASVWNPVPSQPGLIVALPGKATLAYSAAEKVVAMIPQRTIKSSSKPEKMTGWSSEPDFRHHSEFVSQNESELKDGE